MSKENWTTIIKDLCEKAGTYQPFFDPVIESLAGILEMRDNAREKFEASGGNTIVLHTNKGGATNIVKNPALVVYLDCEGQALNYWRDLGLTPKAYKGVTGTLDVKAETLSLEDMLAEMGV